MYNPLKAFFLWWHGPDEQLFPTPVITPLPCLKVVDKPTVELAVINDDDLEQFADVGSLPIKADSLL